MDKEGDIDFGPFLDKVSEYIEMDEVSEQLISELVLAAYRKGYKEGIAIYKANLQQKVLDKLKSIGSNEQDNKV